MDLSDIFIMIRQGLMVLEREPTVPFSSHYVKGLCYLIWLLTNSVGLNHLAEVEFVSFSTVKLLYFPFPYCPLYRKISVLPILKGSGFVLQLLEDKLCT